MYLARPLNANLIRASVNGRNCSQFIQRCIRQIYLFIYLFVNRTWVKCR